MNPTAAETAYRSDTRPDFAPFVEPCGSITGFAYAGDLATELRGETITAAEALELLDDMLAIREFEEMIVRLRSGGYDALPGVRLPRPDPRLDRPGGDRRRSVARRSRPDDYITSTHRGHGDAIAKGFAAIRRMDEAAAPGPRARRPRRRRATSCSRRPSRSTSTARSPSSSARRRATAKGAAAGCTSPTSRSATWAPTRSSAAACRSPPARRWPSATSAPTAVVCCFAGDGAYANGVVLESLNWAAQDQLTNHLAGDQRVRPADRLPDREQPLRHDPPDRRRGDGRPPPRPARRRASPTTTCTPRS